MKTKLFSIILAFLTIVAWNVPMAEAEVDVTEMISILPSGLDFNKKEGVTAYTFKLKNITKESLAGPFRVVIEDMDNDSVSILNPDGMTPEGKPFFLYNQLELGGKSKTESKKWLFKHQCKNIVLVAFKERWFFKLFSRNACSRFVTVYASVLSDSGINNAPVAVIEVSPQTTVIGSTVQLSGAQSSDPDGDALTYEWSVATRPVGSVAEIPEPTAVNTSFVPDAVGNYVIFLVVRDSSGTPSQPDSVGIDVTTANHAPSITSTPITSAVVGQIYSYDVVATDLDAGDALTFSLAQAPEGMTINTPTAGAIRWTPTAMQIGSQQVLVKVEDNYSASAIQDFDIQVRILVPDVVGEVEDQAIAAIQGASLLLGVVTQAHSDTVPVGIVISQDPVASTTVEQGVAVDLVVSLGPSVPPPAGVLLDGAPKALALSTLYDLDLLLTLLPPVTETDTDGVMSIRNRFFMGLKSTALVEEVNALLIQVNGRITGMIAGVPWVIIDIPDPGSRTAFEAIMVQAEESPAAEYVVSDALLTTAAMPALYDPGTLGGFELIDHLIAVGAPAAWNARESLVQTPMMAPVFLVADYFGGGPPQYPPFGFAVEPNDFQTGDRHDHGYAVLSTMGADYGADPGTGLLPTGDDYRPQLRAVDVTSDNHIADDHEFYSRVITRIQNRAAPLLDAGRRIVLNTSLRFICDTPAEAQKNCSDDPSLPAHSRYPRDLGRTWLDYVRTFNVEERMLHATAAGNYAENGIPASLASPFNAAALLPMGLLEPLRNTLVVGNVVADDAPPYRVVCSADTSSLSGNIAAVGTDVSAYVYPNFDFSGQLYEMNGTSFSAPQVAALGYYVWALDENLTAIDVAQKLINSARTIAPEDVDPSANAACNQTRDTLEPVINAYAAVLSVDDPVALSEVGTPSKAPVRYAILDVADSNGVEGSDGVFDQGDLMLFKDKILQGVGAGLSNCTGYDWSRYDLSGEGHTGADWGSKFNLDINKSAEGTYVTAPHDPDMSFNEGCATDLQVLCYYAHSPLYQGSPYERDDLLKEFCGGQKTWTWTACPYSIPEIPFSSIPELFYNYNAKYYATDRQGNHYAAVPYYVEFSESGPVYGILISRIDSEGATTITQLQSPPVSLSVSDFYIDNIGNIILIYLSSAYNDVDGYSFSLVARRYSLENGWDGATNVLWSFTRPIGRVYYSERVVHADIAADECGNAVLTWVTEHTNYLEHDPSSIWSSYFKVHAIRYDVNLGWGAPVQIALEDPEWIHQPGNYQNPEPWQDGFTRAMVAMSSKGDAILVWTGYWAANQTRAIWAKEYKVGSGWGETRRIAAPGMLTDELLDMVMDRSGNAIVTSYSNGGGTRVTHYDIRDGWHPSFIISDNYGLNNNVVRGAVYRISMDECGNAMIVYEHVTGNPYFEGQVSLRSKRYSVDDGWDSEATVIDAQLGVIYSEYFCETTTAGETCGYRRFYEGEHLNGFTLYGGGNATLIKSSPISVSARQYRPGLGWDDSASTFHHIVPVHPIYWRGEGHNYNRQIALIDKYGNATVFWEDPQNNNFTTEFK